MLGQHFERDQPVALARVERTMDLAHPATTQEPAEPVRPEHPLRHDPPPSSHSRADILRASEAGRNVRDGSEFPMYSRRGARVRWRRMNVLMQAAGPG